MTILRLGLLAALLALAAPAHSEEPARGAAAGPSAAAEDCRFPFNLSPEARTELNHQARVEMARRCAAGGDVLGWGLALFPEKFELPFCVELHGYLVEIRLEPFTNTEAPRGFAKTTMQCFLVQIYQALVESTSFRHYLNVQSTEVKALAINTAIKLELEENRALREIYGDQVGKTRWTDKQFVLRNGVIFTAVGAGQSIRGINYRNVRPDYVTVDDLYDEEDIHNVESTEKKTAWFWGSLFKATAKGRRTALHVQGTAINKHDLLEELKGKQRWKSRTFRGIVDFAEKKVLWPEHTTYDAFMADLADMPTVIFNREIQNERHDDAESLVKKDWLKDWEYDVIPSNLIVVSRELSVDPSIGEKHESDYTGAALIVKTRHPDALPGAFEYWIEDLWNEHWSLNQRVLRFDALRQRQVDREQPLSRANVEAVAGFNDFAAELARRTALPVHRVNPKMDKLAHLESKSHHFENRRVHLRRGVDKKLKDTLIYQLTTNDPKHDDVRDAVLIGLDGAKSGAWRVIA